MPESFIYDSIIRIRGIAAVLEYYDLPRDEEFIINEWVHLNDAYLGSDDDADALVDIDEVSWEYKHHFGIPEIVGRNYEIHISDILRDSHNYQKLLDLLDRDDFPIKAEFLAVRAYLQELIDKRKPVSDDLFDLFQ